MKKYLSLIMTLALLMCTTACGTPSAHSQIENEANSTYATLSVSQEERNHIENFLNDPANNGFIQTDYDSPENISLDVVLYDGAGIGVFGTSDWTKQEKEDVLAATGWDAFHNPPLKIDRYAVEKLVEEKLGLSLTEIKTKPEDSFCYIEKYNAYYAMHADTNYQHISVLEVQQINGNYSVKYSVTEASSPKTGCVLLQKKDNGFHFLSNQKNSTVT